MRRTFHPDWLGFASTMLVMLALLAAAPARADCPLPAQREMLEAQLLFGRDIPGGGGQVSDTDWTKFVSEVLAKNFPDGFTATDAQGTWRDAKTGSAVHERSKIVLVDGAANPDFARKLSDVAEAYRVRFGQDAVGIVTRSVCAAF